MTNSNAFGSADLGVVACKHVADGSRPVTLVTRYDDGDWSFSCGQTDHSDEVEESDDFVLIHVDHVLRSDASITQVADLPTGWFAERTAQGDPWQRYPDPA